MQAAVIGIGFNSVRALVARNNGGIFERLYRDREGTRLFAGLDSRGMLKEESILKTAEAVRRMVLSARGKGAEDLSVFATSAARDAANGQYFMDAIEAAAGEVVEGLPRPLLKEGRCSSLPFRGGIG